MISKNQDQELHNIALQLQQLNSNLRQLTQEIQQIKSWIGLAATKRAA